MSGAPATGEGRPPGEAPAGSEAFFVAIDGPGGAGKSTVASRLAARLGWPHLDTGAMYRAVALLALRRGVEPSNGDALGELAEGMDLQLAETVLLGGEDVTKEIRAEEVDRIVSVVAAHPRVRAALVARQRAWAAVRGRGIVEGRDIGSVVLPEAGLKVYLDAHPEVRAARRSAERAAPVGGSISERDRIDSTREASPLVVADGAVLVDSTSLGVEEVVDRLLGALAEQGVPVGALPAPADPVSPSASASPGPGGPAAPRRPAAPRLPPPVRRISKGELAFYAFARFVVVGTSRLVLPGPVIGRRRLPRQGSYVLAPTHRSYVDWAIAVRVTRRRLRFMVKSEVWASKGTGRLVEALGGFPVHRGSADREAFNRALEVLAAGEPLVVFPEGTRRSGTVVEDLQEGAAYLALRAGVPIYPVALGGTERSMPRGSRLPRPARLRIVVGAPLHPAEVLAPSAPEEAGRPRSGRVPRAATRALTERLQVALQEALDEAERRLPRGPS